jgi:twitching motility protein PilT
VRPAVGAPPPFITSSSLFKGSFAVDSINLELIDPLLQNMWDRGGTDLLLTTNSSPRIRVDGELREVDGFATITSAAAEEILKALLDDELMEIFETRKDVDFSFSWLDRARVRGNAFLQKGDVAIALRMIPSRIPNFEQLGLPSAATWLSKLPRGFVLVTGPTGSGKSTTLASMIDFINETRHLHILTVEDPIEYVHNHKNSAVNQREIGTDSGSFDRALRSALREDPDVLLIGEMRDLESIQIALTMAETGHLVFATLHTNDASQAIDRIIDVFPAWRQDQIRVQLSASLAAVIAQRLVPKIGGGMVAAFEILIATSASRNMIREGKTNQLRNIMTTSKGDGMRTLEMTLAELVKGDVVSYEDALNVSSFPKELARELGLSTIGIRDK